MLPRDETWLHGTHVSTSCRRQQAMAVRGAIDGLDQPAVNAVVVVGMRQERHTVDLVWVGGHGGVGVTRLGLHHSGTGLHRHATTCGHQLHHITGHRPAVALRAPTVPW